MLNYQRVPTVWSSSLHPQVCSVSKVQQILRKVILDSGAKWFITSSYPATDTLRTDPYGCSTNETPVICFGCCCCNCFQVYFCDFLGLGFVFGLVFFGERCFPSTITNWAKPASSGHGYLGQHGLDTSERKHKRPRTEVEIGVASWIPMVSIMEILDLPINSMVIFHIVMLVYQAG